MIVILNALIYELKSSSWLLWWSDGLKICLRIRAVCEAHLMAIIRFSEEDMISEYFDLSSPSKELELVSGSTNIVTIFRLNPDHTVPPYRSISPPETHHHKQNIYKQLFSSNKKNPPSQSRSICLGYGYRYQCRYLECFSPLSKRHQTPHSFIPLDTIVSVALPFLKRCIWLGKGGLFLFFFQSSVKYTRRLFRALIYFPLARWVHHVFLDSCFRVMLTLLLRVLFSFSALNDTACCSSAEDVRQWSRVQRIHEYEWVM